MAAPLMMDQMTDEQFDEQTFALIAREFGVGGLSRFIRLHRSGRGDYTAERQGLVGHLTVDQILNDFDAEKQP